MKKILLILLLFCNYQIFPIDLPSSNMELLKILKRGKGECELLTQLNSPAETGPTAFAFDKEGNLYISDILNEKLVKFDSNFNCVDEYRDGYAWAARQLFIDDNNNFIVYYEAGGFAIDDSNGKKKVFVSLFDSKYRKLVPSRPDFIFINNDLYFRLRSGELVKMDDPGTDNGKNVEKATKDIQSNTNESKDMSNRSMKENSQNEKLKIEKLNGKDVITYDDKVKTTDFSIFKKYWTQKREEEKQMSRSGEPPTKEPDLSIFEANSNNRFIGKDLDGNYYWDVNSNSVYIFDSKGMLLKYFSYNTNQSRTDPTVHPSGDVYFLDYNEKEAQLYKVARVW